MVRQNWQGAWLSDLVKAHLDLFGASSRAQIEGPPLFLNANAVQNIGFALHELATNASKYGAIKSPQGRVLVTWRGPEEDGLIHMDWVERDGPLVQTRERRGFGSLVMIEIEEVLTPEKPDAAKATALVNEVMRQYNAILAEIAKDARAANR